MPRVHLTLTGRVQGVGFRYFAHRVAQRLNLGGWVRNLPNGSVEVEVEGPRAALEAFAAEMERGPSAAQVTHCAKDWMDTESGGREFRIVD